MSLSILTDCRLSLKVLKMGAFLMYAGRHLHSGNLLGYSEYLL